MSKPNFTKLGEAAFARIDKVNAELLSLTYGSLVTQLLKDFEDVAVVNSQLNRLGHRMGLRMVDEFLAKSQVGACSDFAETVEVVAKVAFKMFLGCTCEVGNWTADGNTCSMFVYDDPLVEFVELPPSLHGLHYSNLLCGIIRGALEPLHLKVDCYIASDVLKGDEKTEIRIELQKVLREEFLEDDG